VAHDLHEQQRVDVAAGEDAHDRRLEGLRVVDDGRQGRRAGGLDHELRALEGEQQRAGREARPGAAYDGRFPPARSLL
jgi:hypothetical protein